MSNCKKFIALNVGVALTDGLALWLAIKEMDDIAVRQLLREFESSYPKGYGKQVLMKTFSLLSRPDQCWLKTLY
jgi:hypothetical protein